MGHPEILPRRPVPRRPSTIQAHHLIGRLARRSGCARGSQRELERSMTGGGIRYDTGRGLARTTIDYPDRLSSLADADGLALSQAFDRADADPEIGVIVLTGAGDRSFCAGGYLADIANFNFERSRAVYRNSGKLFNSMRKARQPII